MKRKSWQMKRREECEMSEKNEVLKLKAKVKELGRRAMESELRIKTEIDKIKEILQIGR